MEHSDEGQHATSVADRVALADGNTIPVLALGVWQVPEGRACVDAVSWALEAGYRHIDTAQGYGNEPSVGEAIRRSGLNRQDLFVTTKFLPRQGSDPGDALAQSLVRLSLDYVDLYLVHWPAGGPTWAWPGMERAAKLGYARSVGVSNFDMLELQAVTKTADMAPVVDQVQLSPFSSRRKLLEEGARLGVRFEAYGPLGTGSHLTDRTVRDVAAQLGRSPAQVLLRWCIQRGLIVIAKSTHKERIAENGAIFDFELAASEMKLLDALDRTNGTASAQERKWW
jgi:2,5-diketo-D-gluconate reductase A